MIPHDVLGIQLEIGQLVAVSQGNRLHLGVVEQVLTGTGSVDVRTVVLDRIPEEEIERFLFPANQIVSMPFTVLNHHNPLHYRLLDILFPTPTSEE